jgi:hypothetical protein
MTTFDILASEVEDGRVPEFGPSVLFMENGVVVKVLAVNSIKVKEW